MTWRPRILRPVLLFGGVALTLFIGGSTLLVVAIRQLMAAPQFGALSLRILGLATGGATIAALGIQVALWLIRQTSVRFFVDRNSVQVRWRGGRQYIPIDALMQEQPARVPNYQWGIGNAHDRVDLATTQAHYRLLVAGRDEFLAAVEQRRALGVVQHEPERIVARWPAWVAFQRDPFVAITITAALIIWLVAVALVCARFTSLSPAIVLRFNPLGGVLGARPRSGLLQLPVVGLGLLGINITTALYAFHRGSVIAGHMLLLAVMGFELLVLGASFLVVLR
ncbi:MAG: hypothetical protein NVSMB42_20990 [Herpetosiphon sp.]